MSSTSIQDQGYTPPDFLEKLFKRTSTATSQNFYSPLASIGNYTTNYSAPIIPLNQLKYSSPKLHRAHSLNQQQRLSTKKFKIFYNTIMEGLFPELQSLQIWQKFQKSLNNPFDYDQFIEQLRNLKETQKQQKNKTQLKLSDLNLQKLPEQSKSCNKIQDPEHITTNQSKIRLSLRKVRINQKEQKQKMKKSIKYVCGITRHGQKYIKSN